jgi:hypothetical protein
MRPRPFGFEPLSKSRQKNKHTAQGGVFVFEKEELTKVIKMSTLENQNQPKEFVLSTSEN